MSNYPYPPMPPKRSVWRWYRRQHPAVKVVIGCPATLLLAFVVLFIVAFIFALVSPPKKSVATVPSSTTVVQVTHAARPTPTPTPKPTPKPTLAPTQTAAPTAGDPLAPVQGDTVLGQPLSHFVARYGTPQVMADGASYDFQNHTVSLFAFKQYHYLVSAVLYGNADGNGWSDQESAVTACRQFLPPDATYKRDVTISGGIERVYLAPSLANLFPASEFTDEKGDVTTAGTIAIVYNNDVTNTNRIISCSVQIGLQQQ